MPKLFTHSSFLFSHEHTEPVRAVRQEILKCCQTPASQSETRIRSHRVFNVSVFYIDGAAEQRAEPQSLPHDVEQERWSLLQVVAL